MTAGVSRRKFSKAVPPVICLVCCLAAISGCEKTVGLSASSADSDDLAVYARQTLEDYTGHSQALLRAHAIEALARAPDELSTKYIINGLTDPYPGVRFAACMALMKLAHKPAQPMLRKLLNDPDVSVQAAAAGALHVLGQRHLSVFGRALKSPDAAVRRNACLVLGRMGDKGAVKVLKDRYLSDKDLSVRLQAAEAMALLGNSRAVRLMLNYCRSGYDDEAILALQTLGRIGGDKAREQVAYVYEHSSGRQRLGMRLAAARSLAMLGDDRGYHDAVKALDYRRGSAEDSARIRVLAALALGEMGNKAALGKLKQAMEDENNEVRIAAASAILQITE